LIQIMIILPTVEMLCDKVGCMPVIFGKCK
jgi:hypothetical protein